MKTALTTEGFESLSGGAESKPSKGSRADAAKIAQLKTQLEELRTKMKLAPEFQAELRTKIRAGLDEDTALQVLLTDHERDVYLLLDPRDAAELLLADLEPQLAPLRELATNHLGQRIPLPTEIEQKLWNPLAAATALAEKIFVPILESKRVEAREQVKDLARDEARADRMVEDHWDVSRVREFLAYIDCAGNNTIRRLELLVEFLGEYVANTPAPVSQPAS